jgi:hypothetical protein
MVKYKLWCQGFQDGSIKIFSLTHIHSFEFFINNFFFNEPKLFHRALSINQFFFGRNYLFICKRHFPWNIFFSCSFETLFVINHPTKIIIETIVHQIIIAGSIGATEKTWITKNKTPKRSKQILVCDIIIYKNHIHTFFIIAYRWPWSNWMCLLVGQNFKHYNSLSRSLRAFRYCLVVSHDRFMFIHSTSFSIKCICSCVVRFYTEVNFISIRGYTRAANTHT